MSMYLKQDNNEVASLIPESPNISILHLGGGYGSWSFGSKGNLSYVTVPTSVDGFVGYPIISGILCKFYLTDGTSVTIPANYNSSSTEYLYLDNNRACLLISANSKYFDVLATNKYPEYYVAVIDSM